MGKKEFQKDVRAEGGYILSEGTLNLKHLLPKAYDLIEAYSIRKPRLLRAIEGVFKVEPVFPLFNEVFYGLELPEENEEEASYIWNEDVYNFFSELAPNGYYFGSSEGDGACIGWFKAEEE